MSKSGNISFTRDDASPVFNTHKIGDKITFRVEVELDSLSLDEFGHHAEFVVKEVVPILQNTEDKVIEVVPGDIEAKADNSAVRALILSMNSSGV